MPKRLELRVTTPSDVFAATQAFGTEIRVHLIRYFAHSPGQQVDAVRALVAEPALHADRAVVSLNVRALVDTGVLIVGDEDTREKSYRVDHERLAELVEVLDAFTHPV